ncbi:hypothetical protein UFOVP204_118 [uncultured Caudovirales phage]|uniref:Uncharacterized protein n=1 Tax=uncultured Caudovirales phage TaxID=2100421 RepID=A0A6J7WKD4_9CAUD|nr:hypothetical protein UFOVP204_118 [uncultured Caudovirales phage]
MTHDELLADIDTKILLSEHTIYPIYMQAFRAVVELHKPWNFGCSHCINIEGGYMSYPCPTIQAIEKELG